MSQMTENTLKHTNVQHFHLFFLDSSMNLDPPSLCFGAASEDETIRSVDTGGIGLVINMKITKRTQSKSGKNPLKAGHSCEAAAFAMAKRTQI
jgi:hypothetical protein